MGLALRGLRHNCQSIQTEISGSSLSSLSKEIVLQNLVKDVLENECRSVWNDEMMKHKKSILNGILPTTVIEELYRELFSINSNRPGQSVCSHMTRRSSRSKFNWKEELITFNGKKFFNLWWFFLDEEFTKKLEISSFVFFDGNFNLELIGYLAEKATALTSLHLSYNWILKADYLKVFQKQVYLRHLTLYGEINDSFLDLIGSNLSLLSLSFGEEATFQRTTVRKFVSFLDTQSDCLEELSWNASDSLFQLNSLWSRNSNDILKSIVRLTRLTRLQLHSHWIKFLDVTRSLTQLEHLTLYSSKVHYFSKMKVETFPSLRSLSLDLAIAEDDDLSQISDFCINNPKTEISSMKAVVFNVHPFRLLEAAPNAVSVTLKYAKIESGITSFPVYVPAFAPELLRVPKLTELCVEAKDYVMTFEDFKLLWSSFPGMTKLSVSISSVTSFDENVFVEFLSGQKSMLSNLRVLDLRFADKNVGRLTGKSVIAILRSCKNLMSFDNFLYFTISSKDKEEVTSAAESLGFNVLKAKEVDGLWCSEGDHFDLT